MRQNVGKKTSGSLASVTGKMLEKLSLNMYNRTLREFGQSQHGVLVKESLTTNLLEIFEEITNVIHKGN